MGVSIISLFENKNADTIIKIYIINCGISNENLAKINLIAKKYKTNFTYINVNINDFNDYSKSFHLNHTVYFKMMLAKLINEDKFIYIDSDTIITKDLLELFHCNLENYSIGGAKAQNELNHIKKYPNEFYNLYINTGILLINKNNWNKNNLTNIILNFAKNNPDKMPLLDQDAINFTCQDKIKIIDKKFNFEVHHFLPILTKIKYKKELNKNKICVIHFIGRIKPWSFLYNGPFKKQYKKYLKLSPWYNYRYPDFNLWILIKKIYFFIFPVYFTKFFIYFKKLI